jgi:carbon-monoxide dehydrogenase small subunit
VLSLTLPYINSEAVPSFLRKQESSLETLWIPGQARNDKQGKGIYDLLHGEAKKQTISREGLRMKRREEIVLKVNGINYQVEVEPWRTLVEVLRETLGLTGTKKSCNEGECGACTVMMDGRPVASCLVLAMDAQGKEIVTIEGLSQGERLHPIQEAFLKHGAIQCGFCTPGMVISAKALLDQNPRPTETEVRKAISGNLCRCTGYQHIVDSIMAASKMMEKP